jgi:mono/diheme cytochrome c family protein
MKVLTFLLLLIALDAHAAGADDGKAAFIRHGCYECHGFAGQGGAGKKLAPEPMAFDAFAAIVRNSTNAMPPYQKAILSDADLAAIYAYVRSIPKAQDYKSIPLLNQ